MSLSMRWRRQVQSGILQYDHSENYKLCTFSEIEFYSMPTLRGENPQGCPNFSFAVWQEMYGLGELG